MDYEKLREVYRQEGWGRLAEDAGFDPVHTEASTRNAFRYCYKRIKEVEEYTEHLERFIDRVAVWVNRG